MTGSTKSALNAFMQASMELGPNRVVSMFRHSDDDQIELASVLRDKGLSSFVNLTHRYDDSKISLALYAGDGVVVKIIPYGYTGRHDPIHCLPPITSETVDTGNHSAYVIETYPWVCGKYTTMKHVNKFGKIMNDNGLKISKGDAHVGNVHMLPDLNNTLIGIDSDMVERANNGYGTSPDTQRAWLEYIRELYPIYTHGVIPPQTETTTFDYISLHDKKTNLVEFDSTKEYPIIRRDQQKQDSKPPFWHSILE